MESGHGSSISCGEIDDERLIKADDLSAEPAVISHVRSCIACGERLTRLRAELNEVGKILRPEQTGEAPAFEDLWNVLESGARRGPGGTADWPVCFGRLGDRWKEALQSGRSLTIREQVTSVLTALAGRRVARIGASR
jgi:hypothetical protein